tara:strand:- start:789 stop:1160 length:372 start_codon:yes stop_codon:yes gene_type:complete
MNTTNHKTDNGKDGKQYDALVTSTPSDRTQRDAAVTSTLDDGPMTMRPEQDVDIIMFGNIERQAELLAALRNRYTDARIEILRLQELLDKTRDAIKAKDEEINQLILKQMNRGRPINPNNHKE